MFDQKVVIIASSVRCWLWPEFMESIADNKTLIDVMFAGNLDRYQVRYFVNKYPNLQYIHTPVKPAQCYQLCFLHAEFNSLILWAADDCEFEPGQIDKTVDFYNSLNDQKAIVSMRTDENRRNFGTEVHTLIGWNVNTPLMAPIGMVSQRYIAILNGFDRRFISGQWENDFVMRAMVDGGTVYPFDPGPSVKIDHTLKHRNREEKNPFWSGYQHDRTVLENTWIKGGYKPTTPYVKVTYPNGVELPMFKIIDNRRVLSKPQLSFEPYEDKDLLTVNQGPAGDFAFTAPVITPSAIPVVAPAREEVTT